MERFAEVLARFDKLKQVKDGYWTALCPAHEDRSRSLSLWIGRDGRLMIGCWAGCPKPEVLKAAGLKWGDIMADAKADKTWQPPVRRKVVAVYDYTDEQGKLLYQKIRYMPKGFASRQPDTRPEKERSKDGWWWCLHGVRRVLYRLPELLAADPARLVYVVEGEKCADYLRTLGLVATTNADGAGVDKWLKEYSVTLRGRHVAVWPDNDPSGFRHAFYVVGHLMTHGAQSVRLITPPGLKQLPAHCGADDWLRMGHGVEELAALADRAKKMCVAV